MRQSIADTPSLWTLPANVIAAAIATALGLVLSAAVGVQRAIAEFLVTEGIRRQRLEFAV